ncbi:hypothetical protein [Tropicimonas sp.]|uniref:hypothetical protein n=1 Tax=Tropicimonas sp. TaxID=2067044 RepID=UPI003A87F64B
MHPPFRQFRLFLAALLPVLATAGCATFPQLEAGVSAEARAAPDPELMDSQAMLAAERAQTIDAGTQQRLSAEAAALRARAAALQGPVMDSAERESLQATSRRLREDAARVAPET